MSTRYDAPQTPRLSTGGASESFLGDHLGPAFACATHIDVVVAFAQRSGVELLRRWLLDAASRMASVRLLVSDYLKITHPDALRLLMDLEDVASAQGGAPVSARVLTQEQWRSLGTSFHPKAWIVRFEDGGRAWVGSSNISAPALVSGVEWNMRLERGEDPTGFAQLVESFEQLWGLGQPLAAEWIERYAQARARHQAPPEEEPALAPVMPHPIQAQALAALERSREQGHQRALVVMATGLGKTWLAALDVRATGAKRVLVIAHRVELLEQALEVLRRVLPMATVGWCVGGQAAGLDAELVLASVASLAQPERLSALGQQRFDYVIVDEAHHAPASSYQRILAQLDAGFILGLTATPDRLDLASVEGAFHDHIAFRADLGRGLQEGLLASVRYWGVADTIDYTALRFGALRFDQAQLEEALLMAHEVRMRKIWSLWREHPGQKTLIFCQSVRHAQAVRDWLGAQGVRVEAIWAGAGSAHRHSALERLQSGQLEALCAVDLLNEGVDIPSLDRVVMLRPTESPVIFLQQLGRGLRLHPDKAYVTVLDLVGNHRAFLDRFELMLSSFGHSEDARRFLAARGEGAAVLKLPKLEVHLELEAVDVLRDLLKPSVKRSASWRVYEDAFLRRAVRPQAQEVFRLGALGGAHGDVRRSAQSWFDFLQEQGALSPAELRAWQDAAVSQWLMMIERQQRYNKSFKLVVLRALLDQQRLWEGMEVEALCLRCYELMRGDPALWADITQPELRAMPQPPLNAHQRAIWREYWCAWPLQVWAGQERRQKGRVEAPFRLEDGRFWLALDVSPEHQEIAAQMTSELVDFLLARHHKTHLGDVM